MSRKRILFGVILLLLIAGAWYGYHEYTRKVEDLHGVNADHKIDANTFITEFDNNDSLSMKRYNGKIIELKGQLRKTEKDEHGYITLVLGNDLQSTSVRCAMDSTYASDAARVTEKQSITLRGACTGFNKDDMGLGSDIILNRCVIIH